jgi:hypothetical protein
VWVEAMRQETLGSLDERLPYLLSKARLAFPDVHAVLVLEGPGWRPGALALTLHRAVEIDDKHNAHESSPLAQGETDRRKAVGGASPSGSCSRL